jgi:transposase
VIVGFDNAQLRGGSLWRVGDQFGRAPTRTWLATRPTGQFEFTFAPKHGSWLNLVEGFFSKLARSVLRHIRVASKQELKDRIMAAMDYFNQEPVVHTWAYKLDKAA